MIFQNENEYFMQKVVFLTGGASGIGLALVKELQRFPLKALIVVDRDEANLKKVELLCKSSPYPVKTFALDVTQENDVKNIVSQVHREFAGIDLLYNVAGIGNGGEIQDIPTKDFQKIMDVNFMGILHTVKAIYPSMIARKAGQIVNVTSVAGLVPLPGESAYVASKYAAVGFTECLQIEAVHYGVQVSMICPGVVQTPIYQTGEIIGFDKNEVLNLFPKGITAEKCAQKIIKATLSRKKVVLITLFAKFLSYNYRFFPGLMKVGLGSYINKMRKFKTP